MSNVVELPLGVRVSPLLEKVAQVSRTGVSNLLSNFFDSIDDALFELADRSRSDSDQQIYFESMRELRLARPNVERLYLDDLVNKLLTLPNAPEPKKQAAAATYDTLTLVRNDELEITVAIAGIVSKITGRYSVALTQLGRRFDAICPRHAIEDRDNPLGPQQLCESFVSSTDSLQLDIKIRIILLKLFERTVAEHMGPVYDNANRLLADAGVMRNLKDFPARPRRSGAHPLDTRNAERGGSAEASLQGGDADRGQTDQESARGAPLGRMPGASEISARDANHANAGTQRGYDTQDLLAALGLSPALMAPLRTSSDNASYAHPGFYDGTHSADGRGRDDHSDVQYTAELSFAPPGFPGFGYLESGHGQRGANAAAAPFFGTNELIAAIARAQQQHAAAQQSLDQVPPSVDYRPVLLGALSAMHGKEGRLANTDEDVVNLVGMLFDYILNDRNLAIPMKALLGRLQIPYLKVALMDKRFFTQSSHPARQLLNELSSAGIGWSNGAELKRDPLYNLIESVVLRVLSRFERDLVVFQALLEELRTFRTQDDRRNKVVEQRIKDAELGRSRAQAAKRNVARIIEQKAHGLELPLPVRDFIKDVWSKVLMFVCLRHGVDGREWQLAIENFDELLWCAQPLTNYQSLDERERMLPRLRVQLRDGLTLIAGDASLLTNLEETLAERVQSDRQKLRGAEVPELHDLGKLELLPDPLEIIPDDQPAPNADTLGMVDRLRPETWIEFKIGDAPPMRSKLASILDDGQRLLFVNRKGMKVLERTRHQLAREFETAAAVILEERQLFDRALERVIKNLRQHDSGSIALGDAIGSGAPTSGAVPSPPTSD